MVIEVFIINNKGVLTLASERWRRVMARFRFVGYLCLGGLSCLAHAREIKICADPGPAPWTYWVVDAHQQKTNRFTGSSVDTFRTVFTRLGLPVSFVGDLPWARCLKMVEEGKIDFAMDAYFNNERAKTLAFSKPYNTLTPQVFYRRQNPIQVKTKSDLKRYKGCGMIGASYEHYGLSPAELDLGVNTYAGMVNKLKAGRCDYFVEELEVIAGHSQLGQDFLKDKDLLHNAVEDADAPSKHLVTATQGLGSELLPAINTELNQMSQTGELAKIWKKHAGRLPFKREN